MFTGIDKIFHICSSEYFLSSSFETPALIESGYYSSNPYHNAVHAADVVQAMHFNLQEPKVCNRIYAYMHKIDVLLFDV